MAARSPGCPGPGWDDPWWQGFLGWLLPLLFLVGIAALVVWAVLRVTERGQPAPLAARRRCKRGRIGEPCIQFSDRVGSVCAEASRGGWSPRGLEDA
jgi:hypothetical protein